MEIRLKVEGMMCPHCENRVTKALLALPGVTSATADHKASSVTVQGDGPLTEQAVREAVVSAGYRVL